MIGPLKYVLQKNLIQGEHQYRLFKINANNIIYDGETKIYHYNDSHTDFLKMLPYVTISFETYETELKSYYEYADSSSYNADTAKKKIENLNKHFQKIHPFLQYSDVALLNIRRALFEYFCKTSSYRFLAYLENDLNKPLPNLDNYRDHDLDVEEQEKYDQSIQMWDNDFQKEFPNFLEKEHKLCNHLFLPICNLMFSGISEKNIKGKLDNIWTLFRLSDYNHFKSEKERDSRTFYLYLYQDTQNKIKKKYRTTNILSRLKFISNTFSDYFSVFSDLSNICGTATNFHPYALLLTNNYHFYKIFDSCKFYSEHQTMHNLIEDNLYKIYHQKNTKVPILSLHNIPETLSDNFYTVLKELLNNPNKDTKDYLSRQLIVYYPSELKAYMGGTLIEFQDFEQLIAIELLDIIVQNKSIKKCPECGIYFISHSRNRKYCETHKNNHSLCQKNSMQQKKEVEILYNKYRSCFYSRLKREKILQKDFEYWNKESQELVQTYTSLREYDIDQFIKELNSICKKLGIKPPRNYSKQS